MLLIIVIDVLVISVFLGIALSKGLEKALPFFTFVVVFLPIESRISLGFFELTTQRLMFVALFVLYLVLGRRKEQSAVKMTTPLKGLMFLHTAWCLISTADSITLLMSVKKMLSVVFEYYLLYFIYFKTIKTTQTIHKILMAMVLAIIVCSIFGTYEAYHGWNVVNMLPRVTHRFDTGEDIDRGNRVHSTFDHPILFGAALALAITVGIYLLSTVRKSWQKVLLWAGLMLMFLNIFKTSSRGPWLDVIIGCALLLILGTNRVRRPILLIVALSVATLIIRPGVWGTIEGIYLNTFDTNSVTGASYEYRPALQRAVINNLLQNPTRAVLGYGLESFYDVRVKGEFLGQPHEFLSADDSWAELAIETGFVGLFILAILLFKPLVLAWKDFWKLPAPESNLSLVFFTNFAIFYFQMYSVGMYSWGQNGYMLWMLIAMSLGYSSLRVAELDSSKAEMSQPVHRATKDEIAVAC